MENITVAGERIILDPLPKNKLKKIKKRKINNPALDRVEKLLNLLATYK